MAIPPTCKAELMAECAHRVRGMHTHQHTHAEVQAWRHVRAREFLTIHWAVLSFLPFGFRFEPRILALPPPLPRPRTIVLLRYFPAAT